MAQTESGWYGSQKANRSPTAARMTDRELLDTAINELAYIIVRFILKVKFVDKPDSFDQIIALAQVPYSKLRPYVREGVLQVISGQAAFGFFGPERPNSPLTNHNGNKSAMPLIHLIEFGGSKHDFWLVDTTGANSYYRDWARVDYEA